MLSCSLNGLLKSCFQLCLGKGEGNTGWTDETDDLDWYPFYIRLSASIRVLLHYIPAINNTPIPMFFT